MSPTWKMGSLVAVWCVILMEGTAILAAQQCINDCYKVNINGGSIYCKPCTPKSYSYVCSDVNRRELECRCVQGYGCSSTSCQSCVSLPICTDTSQLMRSEKTTSDYDYYCKECPKGTYVDSENGICKPGEKQISTTKSSRDGASSSVPSTQNPERSSFNNWTSLALYLALAVFILLLITVAIHLLIWKMKAAQLLKIAGEPFQPHIIINAKEDADSWSCQYPEEEHGEEHGNGPVEKNYV